MSHPISLNNENDTPELIVNRLYRFELSVEGMSCVKCKSKVENILNDMNRSITNIKIDFITNRILLTVPDRDLVDKIEEKLGAAGFGVKDVKDISHSLVSDNRTITLKIFKGHKSAIISGLVSQSGEKLVDSEPVFKGNKCMISYNPVYIRGSEIIERLKSLPEYKEGSLQFSIDNIFEDNIKQIKFSDFTFKQLITVLSINLLNVLLSFIPEKYMYVPESFGMFSFYFLTVLILTILNLYLIGFKIYATCVRQLIASMNVNMLTLVSVGSGFALIFGFIYMILGLVQSLVYNETDLCFFIMNAAHMFHTSATIILALVLGKYIEGKIKKKIYGKIDDLRNRLQVKMTTIQRIVPKNKKFEILTSEEIHPLLIEKDDYITVKNSCMIPFDGFVEKGTLKVVENIQYGWEKIEVKNKGHPIISGSQVIEANEEAIIRVTEPIERTLAGRLFHEIKEATSGGSSSNKTDTLEIITKYFISVILVVALLTFVGWCITGFIENHHAFKGMNYSYPFEKAIAVLVASCPCALGIAIPMMFAITLRKALKSGVLIKDIDQFDTLQTIDTVVFDKTGTITGTYNVKSVEKLRSRYSEDLLWEMVSFLEKDHLQHPVGLLLFQEAIQRTAELEEESRLKVSEEAEKLKEYYLSEGMIQNGVSLEGKEVQIALGNEKLLSRLSISTSRKNSSGSLVLDISSSGKTSDESNGESTPNNKVSNQTVIYLCVDGQVHLRITLSLQEDVKSNASELISYLKNNKIDVHILSGDAKRNVERIGRQIGISEYNIHAEMDPENKEKYIKYLTQEKKKKVLMIGDGLNDIKAFKAATLSCSINFKSSQNLTFSDFIIVNNSLSTISNLFNLASISKTFKHIILACALIYNIPAILAASGALKVVIGVDLQAYLACWTMVLFSLVLTLVANLMELVDITKPRMSIGTIINGVRKAIATRVFNPVIINNKVYVDLEQGAMSKEGNIVKLRA